MQALDHFLVVAWSDVLRQLGEIPHAVGPSSVSRCGEIYASSGGLNYTFSLLSYSSDEMLLLYTWSFWFCATFEFNALFCCTVLFLIAFLISTVNFYRCLMSLSWPDYISVCDIDYYKLLQSIIIYWSYWSQQSYLAAAEMLELLWRKLEHVSLQVKDVVVQRVLQIPKLISRALKRAIQRLLFDQCCQPPLYLFGRRILILILMFTGSGAWVETVVRENVVFLFVSKVVLQGA